jgi:hypothetical protein
MVLEVFAPCGIDHREVAPIDRQGLVTPAPHAWRASVGPLLVHRPVAPARLAA